MIVKNVQLVVINFFLLTHVFADGYTLIDWLREYDNYPPSKILDYIRPLFTRANEHLPCCLSIYNAVKKTEATFPVGECLSCSRCNYYYSMHKNIINTLFFEFIKKTDANLSSLDDLKKLTENLLVVLNEPQVLLPNLLRIACDSKFQCIQCASDCWEIKTIDSLIAQNPFENILKMPIPIEYCSRIIFLAIAVFGFYDPLYNQFLRYEKKQSALSRIYCGECKQVIFGCRDFADEILVHYIQRALAEELPFEDLKTIFEDITNAFSGPYKKMPQLLVNSASTTKFTCSGCKQLAWQK